MATYGFLGLGGIHIADILQKKAPENLILALC
jgi:hypothetical protein